MLHKSFVINDRSHFLNVPPFLHDSGTTLLGVIDILQTFYFLTAHFKLISSFLNLFLTFQWKILLMLQPKNYKHPFYAFGPVNSIIMILQAASLTF